MPVLNESGQSHGHCLRSVLPPLNNSSECSSQTLDGWSVQWVCCQMASSRFGNRSQQHSNLRMNTLTSTPSSGAPMNGSARTDRNTPRTIAALLLSVAIPFGLHAQQQRPVRQAPQAPPASREMARPPGPGNLTPPGPVMPPPRPTAPEFRSWDGRGNNTANPTWGSAGTQYLRERSGAAYADGLSMPPGSFPMSSPPKVTKSRPTPAGFPPRSTNSGNSSTTIWDWPCRAAPNAWISRSREGMSISTPSPPARR